MVFIIGFGPEVGAFRNLFTIPNTLMMILVIISAILTMVAFFSYIPDVIRQVKEKKNKAK
jgi:predicted MFS family arabinose efflux permease